MAKKKAKKKTKKKDTRPCCICKKQLENVSVQNNWESCQPYGGGEIQLIFSFGSTKFDHLLEGTVFRGIICDDCAAKIVPNLYLKNNSKYPSHGELSVYNTELPR